MTTVTTIRNVAEKVLTADVDSESGKVEYLRLLVGDIQTELGASPRQRSGKAPKLSGDERAAQMGAISKVNERFYAVVLEAAKAQIGTGAGKSVLVNRATNWARAQLRDIRSYVRAGNDIRAVATGKLTLKQLRVQSAPRPLGAAALRRRLVDKGKATVAAALELIDSDPVAAKVELELLTAQLATQLLNLSGRSTKDAQEAASQHIPLRVKSTVFVPTDTQVMRQQSNPS